MEIVQIFENVTSQPSLKIHLDSHLVGSEMQPSCKQVVVEAACMTHSTMHVTVCASVSNIRLLSMGMARSKSAIMVSIVANHAIWSLILADCAQERSRGLSASFTVLTEALMSLCAWTGSTVQRKVAAFVLRTQSTCSSHNQLSILIWQLHLAQLTITYWLVLFSSDSNFGSAASKQSYRGSLHAVPYLCCNNLRRKADHLKVCFQLTNQVNQIKMQLQHLSVPRVK